MAGTATGAKSIRDVARTAGVSVATASRVLANANYPVAAATREKVIAAAKSLGFVPNALARSLSRSRSDSIGVIVPVLTNPYYAAMIQSIDAAAQCHGLSVLLSLSDRDEHRREAAITAFLGRRVDGILICAGPDDHLAGRSPEELGVPAVLIGQQATPGFPIITTDNRRAGFEATEYLWGLGHRSFAYLTGRNTWHDFRARAEGMFEFLRTTKEGFDAQVVEGLYNEADAYAFVREAFSAKVLATAVLGSTDRHALGAMASLADLGYRVPHQVSVMGFDDYATSGFVRPSLTTMQMPVVEMGRLGVERLKSMLSGHQDDRHDVLVATIIQRESTAEASGTI